jgi:hypothetical protein
MLVLRLECPAGVRDRLIAEFWERGTAGVIDEDLPGGGSALRAFFDQRFEATEWADYGARWEPAEDRDWIGVAQARWEPLLVGSRFYLAPSWRADPTPPGRLRLEMQRAGVRPRNSRSKRWRTAWNPA